MPCTKLEQRLRDAGIARSYGLECLAIAIGLTEQEIAAVEDGTSTDAHHFGRIERAFG